jgi:hypothetical protein
MQRMQNDIPGNNNVVLSSLLIHYGFSHKGSLLINRSRLSVEFVVISLENSLNRRTLLFILI